MAEILLLEDEESVNRGIEFTLKKEGYEVENAGTIREAWELFQKQEPKLMICDVNLPDGSSLDLIRRIRKTSLVHVICLTAMDTEIDQVMGYEAGADDYITKPFSLSVLVLKVNAFFKRYQKSPADELESGDLLFSMSRMSARKGQEDISFTKNEWKMLKLFLEHPKQILSKNQILEQLFDLDGEFADENTVAVNIRRLREKIEPDTAHPQYIRIYLGSELSNKTKEQRMRWDTKRYITELFIGFLVVGMVAGMLIFREYETYLHYLSIEAQLIASDDPKEEVFQILKEGETMGSDKGREILKKYGYETGGSADDEKQCLDCRWSFCCLAWFCSHFVL